MNQQIRILVIEDDEDLRETLEELLTDEGFTVVTAGRGEEAVQLSSQQLFDLVVTDIKMPGIDGLEALEQVKQRQPEVKSLVVTGYSSHQDAVRAVRLGVGDYLQKPFGLDNFLCRIKEMVEEKQAELLDAQREEETLATMVSTLLFAARMVDERLVVAAEIASKLGPTKDSLRSSVLALTAGLRWLSDRGQSLQVLPSLKTQLEPLEERLAEDFGDFKTAELPLETQLAGLALFKALHPERNPQQHFDESVTTLLTDSGCGPTLSNAQRRSRLTVAQAFERGGDLENAHAAYDDVLGSGRPDQMKLEAALGQARLARSVGGQDLEKTVESLLAVGRQLGESGLHKARLEAGLLLLPRQEARLHLEKAQVCCREGSDELGLARAQLGLACLGENIPIQDSLARLLQPNSTWELCDSAYWLLPWLLEDPHKVDGSIVATLLREAPQALQYALDAGLLSTRAKVLAVETLRQQETPIPLDAVRILLTDSDPQVQTALKPLREKLEFRSDIPTVKFSSFGPFQVFQGDSLIEESTWKHQKVKYLLAYLAKNWRTPVAEQQLLEDLWPGPVDRAKRSLYQATYNLRRCLNKPDSPADYVRREKGQLSLSDELPLWNDLKELEQALALGDVAKNRALIGRALRLYQGPYLDGCLMDWAIRKRDGLEIQVAEALERLAHDSLNRMDFQEALEFADRLFLLDSLNHSGQLLKMKALVGTSNLEAAQQHFKECEQILKDELDEEPPIELLELLQRAKVMAGSGDLIG